MKSKLIEQYKELTSSIPILPFEDSETLPLDQIFAPLSLCEDTASAKRTRSPDSTVQNKPLADYSLLFSVGDVAADRIFLHGEAGAGKTVFCLKILDTWSNVHEGKPEDNLGKCLSEFDLLFYVALRHVHENQTIVDMICDSVSNGDENLIGRVRRALGDPDIRCMVILDGLDEWPLPGGMDGLPNTYGLFNCVTLMTMRPWKIEQLRLTFRQKDKVVSVFGLSRESQERVIKNILEHFYGLKKSSWWFDFPEESKFFEETKTAKLENLFAFPMMLATYFVMWYDGGKRNTSGQYSLTKMYLNLFQAMVKRAQQKNADINQYLTDNDMKFKDFPKIFSQFPLLTRLKVILMPLSKFAYDNLTSENASLIFPRDALEGKLGSSVVNVALKVGILSKSKSPGIGLQQNVLVSFYHKSHQEFMAAMHIAFQQS